VTEQGAPTFTAVRGARSRDATHWDTTESHYARDSLDRAVRANLARATLGISPAVLAMAYFDWMVHLAISPGKQVTLGEKALRKAMRLLTYAGRSMSGGEDEPCIEPLPQDRRFKADAWKDWPFSLGYQSFLLMQQWWYNATTGIPGVERQNEAIVEFVARQFLDMYSPSNFIATNPEVLQATQREGGANLVRGWTNFVEDWQWAVGGRRPRGSDEYVVGRDVAITPGKVVYQNRLIELIQYSPATQTVHPEPVLIVPAWIMKYYILDLSPHNSLVKYLVDKGHTVFMISWKNPTSADRDLDFNDYRKLGVMAALDAIGTIAPNRKTHAVGYCIGGTLLAVATATMARDGEDRLATATLFAAQTDFEEAGELMLFVNESQVTYLEDVMWDQGVLDASQMAGAFQLLRSNDLIWSRMVRSYLLGEKEKISDLMAWNADQTRMPYRMHSEYLRHIFLENQLAEGRFMVEGRPVSITDIRIPIFAVGTEMDHVAPWRSVYKIHLISDAKEITFVLTSGGHNAGIVSEPGHPRRRYRIRTSREGDGYVDPDTWYQQTPVEQGSWWPAWQRWLVAHSGAPQPPPAMGASEAGYPPMADAPGSYVFQS